MAFLDDSYLLTSPVAKSIYDGIRNLPIVDAHNHCDVKALAEDRRFTDIWEAEGATDHYVWEMMRKCNVPEELITGSNRSNREKWNALAAVFEDIAGNPTYEWIHLDLRRRLGIDLEINSCNADAIWEESRRRLQLPEFSQQSLILSMNVETMCSTDDPADTLEYHRQLAGSRLAGRVRPTFRPDAAMNIDSPGWNQYLDRLGQRWGMTIRNIDDFLDALQRSHDYMEELGARASDHGVVIPDGRQIDRATAGRIFEHARQGGGSLPAGADSRDFKAWCLNEVAEMDAKSGWVFQLHYGAIRNVRSALYEALGADVGGDVADHDLEVVNCLVPFLNRFDRRLKVVLYDMNPAHNATLATLSRAFGHTVSLGSAWWLNDSYTGMKNQLELGASIDLLSNMSGMVSDSRKILSYGSRFEMYRRTLSEVLGNMVIRGQMPEHAASRLARRLAYDRPRQLFGF